MATPSLFVRKSPFAASPDPRRYVPVGSIEQARLRIMRAIDRDEGPAVLVGPTGTGKTLLCQCLAAAYRNSMEVALLSDAKLCTRRALLQTILFHLNVPYREREEGELRLSLMDRLRPGAGEGGRDGLLLIVDEAQALAPRLIEELRMLAGMVREGQSRVRLVLAGNMRFEERLSEPSMEPLTQRVAARCYLHPLHLDETRDYIREHMRRVGVDLHAVMDEGAIQAVHNAAVGLPRVINQLMDQAVISAESCKASRIDTATIEAAWCELNQLPAPFVDRDPVERQSTIDSVIEFGELDGDDTTDHVSLAAEPLQALQQKSSATNSVPTDSSRACSDGAACTGEGRCCEQAAQDPWRQNMSNDVPVTTKSSAPRPVTSAEPAAKTNPAAAIVLGNNHALAFSLLDEAFGTSIQPVDALGMLHGLDASPWSVAQVPILNESSLKKQSPAPAVSMPTAPVSAPMVVPAAKATPAATRTVAPSSTDVFGEDFDEVIELNHPLKVSTSGPLPWKGSVLQESDWLEPPPLEAFDEGELHREVVSLADEAQAHTLPLPFVNQSAAFHNSANTPTPIGAKDDRDLLIIDEEVPVAHDATPVAQPVHPIDLEYRSLFSRLRRG